MVIKVLREYDKAHPDAVDLKSVDLKITKATAGTTAAAAGGGGHPNGQAAGGRPGVVTAIVDYRDLVADGDSCTSEDLDSFISELDAESPCIMMLGEVSDAAAFGPIQIEAHDGSATASEQSAQTLGGAGDAALAPSGDGPVANAIADRAIAAVDEARVALAARGTEVAALKARDVERVAAIAKLKEALLQAQASTLLTATTRRADAVTMDATPSYQSSRGVCRYGSVSNRLLGYEVLCMCDTRCGKYQ